MIPQLASTELNRLLQLELAEGSYQSPEDALLAALKLLRENRGLRSELTERLASFRGGRAIVLKDDDSLGAFLDEIDAEVDRETGATSSHDS